MVGDKLISRMVRWPKGPTRRQYLVMDVMFLGKLIPWKECALTKQVTRRNARNVMLVGQHA